MYSLHVSSKSLSHFNFKVNSGVQKLKKASYHLALHTAFSFILVWTTHQKNVMVQRMRSMLIISTSKY